MPPYSWPEAHEYEERCHYEPQRPETTYAKSKQSARGMSSKATCYEIGDKRRRSEDEEKRT